MGSLMLEGTSGVPESNLLLEAGLILNFDWLLRALSGVVLKTYKDKRFYNLSWQLFPMLNYPCDFPPLRTPPLICRNLSCFKLWPFSLLAVL